MTCKCHLHRRCSECKPVLWGNHFPRAVSTSLSHCSHTGTLYVDRFQIHTKHIGPSHPEDCPLKDSRASWWPKPHIWSRCNDLHLAHWRSLGMVILGFPKAEETLQGRKSRKQSGWHQVFHYTHHIHLNNEDGRESVLIFLMGYWGSLDLPEVAWLLS
jgi:hypothetical protein